MIEKYKKYLPVLIWIALALATIIPREAASKENIIGYKSLCSFAPISTGILLLFAYFAFRGRNKKKKSA